jgi:hypothetical protein
MVIPKAPSHGARPSPTDPLPLRPTPRVRKLLRPHLPRAHHISPISPPPPTSPFSSRSGESKSVSFFRDSWKASVFSFLRVDPCCPLQLDWALHLLAAVRQSPMWVIRSDPSPSILCSLRSPLADLYPSIARGSTGFPLTMLGSVVPLEIRGFTSWWQIRGCLFTPWEIRGCNVVDLIDEHQERCLLAPRVELLVARSRGASLTQPAALAGSIGWRMGHHSPNKQLHRLCLCMIPDVCVCAIVLWCEVWMLSSVLISVLKTV